jgi:Transglycosylase SLT domain
LLARFHGNVKNRSNEKQCRKLGATGEMQAIRILTASLGSAVAVTMLCGVAMAQAPDEFTFKRVGPPAKDGEGLLDIQVGPKTEIRRLLPTRVDPETDIAQPAVTPSTEAPWFWNRISPRILDGSAQRLELATSIVESHPDELVAFSINPDELERIAGSFGIHILKASVEAQVSPALLLSLIYLESGGEPGLGDRTGPAGLMQLKPEIVRQFAVTDVMNPIDNIGGGARYLEWLLDRFDGDAILALAAFNTDDAVIRAAKGVPDYPETRLFVPRVVAVWSLARQLCMTPPVKATDGCVFKSLGKIGQ